MDIEKTFDSLDHFLVISVLKKFGFGNNFVSWIETLISKQESCAINLVILPSAFILKEELAKVALFRPISLSLLQKYVRNKKGIKGLNIFDHLFLNTAYADEMFFS